MSISPQKNSIAKVSLGKNPVKGNSGGINNAIIPSSKVSKSAQSSDTTNTSNNDNGDSEVSTDEDKSTWEAGKPISKDADKAASDTTKALWSGYWDFKKSELDNQRGMQQDQLAFQKAQMDAAMQQQNSGLGAGIASQGLGALGQALGALGQSKGGGGSSGGSSGGAKTEEEQLAQRKPFEDHSKAVRVDSKGNPIINDPNSTNNPTTQGLTQQGQAVEAQQVAESSFQARPIDHGQMQVADAQAINYDPENSMTIGSHEDMRSSQSEDMNFELAQNEVEDIEPETPEIEVEDIDEEIA
jgi:hypothetical protein